MKVNLYVPNCCNINHNGLFIYLLHEDIVLITPLCNNHTEKYLSQGVIEHDISLKSSIVNKSELDILITMKS